MVKFRCTDNIRSNGGNKLKEEKIVLKKLKEFGKSYDGLFSGLKEANKLSNKSYGLGKHLKKCFDFTLEFLKAQNVLIRYLLLAIPFLFSFLFAYLKKIDAPFIKDIPVSIMIVGGGLTLLLVLWWIDRRTLLKVTEPTDSLFHIGAYEKFRNKEYKRNHDYFFNDVMSFEELKKDVEELLKFEKDEHKTDVNFYKDKLEEKDSLLMKSLGELLTLRESLSEYSLKHHKLDLIFQDVLVRLASLSEKKLDVSSLDFNHYFTVHRIEAKEYKLICVNHPHGHKYGINYHRKGDSHLYKTERSKDKLYVMKNTLISFVVKGAEGEDWIVTLYPKSKPVNEVQSDINYDKLYVEDIISLWTSFLTLIDASKPTLNNPKGVGNNVKGA